MAGNPAELSRAHQGATRDLTNLIKVLENFWRESLNKTESHINWTKTDNKMSIHRTEMYTDYGNIQKKNTTNADIYIAPQNAAYGNVDRHTC